MRPLDFIYIAVGAVFGANARYAIGYYFALRFGPSFPYGTLFINISGCFLLGFLLTFLSNRLIADPGFRLLLGTGFMGAYTTFSTFGYETIALFERGDLLPDITNVAASVAASLLAAYLGIVVARVIG